MTSDSRYRGIPAEISLQIWRYVLPTRVTILRDGLEYSPFGREELSNRLKLFPALRPQLYCLDKEIYDEILPLYKQVEVHLKPDVYYRYFWPVLSLAIRSPILGRLHYPWTIRAGAHDEAFLPMLRTLPPSQHLSSLIINIEQAASIDGTNLF